MRSKLPRLPDTPEKYVRFRPQDGLSWAEWVAERESWAISQPPVRYVGTPAGGFTWDYWAAPLGDAVDLMVARREARILAYRRSQPDRGHKETMTDDRTAI